MVIKNKKGWIRIVEAFIAILLLLGILLLIVDQKYISKRGISSQMYETELSILRDIELDTTLRSSILNVGLPVFWQNETFPSNVKDKITEEAPSHIECMAKICWIEDACTLHEVESEIAKDIYVQSTSIFADLTVYRPRQLKLFCWVK